VRPCDTRQVSTKQEHEARRRANPHLEQHLEQEHRSGSRQARAAISADLYRVLLERDAQLLGLEASMPALVREALRRLHAEATDRAVLAELDEFYGPGRPAGADPAPDAEG
jgi:hypothetical protein